MNEQFGGMQQPQLPKVQKQINPHEGHVAAVAEWQEACRVFQQAEMRKAAAQKNLMEACQCLAQYMQESVQDPTQANAPVPTNSVPSFGLR